MRLAPGTRLGHYEITALVGAGGMGEVYRARDTRLDRTVAIKILLELGGADPQARERFEREAKVIASLDHPNICALYDTGRTADVDFIVMQFLEGETLAARLKRGPLPLAEALALAGQIADALDRAHSRGIIHRDLKPGNVMLTRSGARLLDFGLARLEVSSNGEVVDKTTRQALTEAGAVMGTLPYMAPEQVSGKAIDARADIWAFGCVLYEMLGGRRPFDGDSQAALIGAIMQATPPPLSQVMPGVPRVIEQVVSGALAKDRADRWQNISDVKRALSLTTGEGSSAGPVAAEPRRWLYAAAALALVAAVAVLVVRSRISGEPPLVRFDVNAATTGRINSFTDTRPYFAASPDGRRLAFVATVDGSPDIWIKRMDGAQPEKVADTQGAQSPFWSPDGQSIAFFARGQLKRLALSNGAEQVLCRAVTGSGIQGTWSPGGVILFAEWSNNRLMKVAENGGTPEPVKVLDDGPPGWPEFLPDGRHYFYTTLDTSNTTAHAFVGSLDSTDAIPIPGVESRVQFAAGRLVFWREGTVVAQPFDLRSFQLAGQPVALAGEVQAFVLTAYASFSVTPTLLVYQSGQVNDRLVWVNRQGLELGTVGPPAEYVSVRLSRDGSNAASSVRDPRVGTMDVFIHELGRDVTRQLTGDRGTENFPNWSPDGKTIVMAVGKVGPPHLYARNADGSGVERQVTPASSGEQSPGSVTPDGRFVVYPQQNPGTSYDIMLVPFDGSAPPKPIVQTPLSETVPKISPDGKWLAFTRQGDVFVQSFPEGRGLRQISRDGGTEARWRRDGKEMYFLHANQLMAVDLRVAGETLDPGAPHTLFTRSGRVRDYDVTADGERFLLIATGAAAERGTLSVVMNWTKLLTP